MSLSDKGIKGYCDEEKNPFIEFRQKIFFEKDIKKAVKELKERQLQLIKKFDSKGVIYFSQFVQEMRKLPEEIFGDKLI